MRRFFVTLGGTVVVLGSSLIAAGQDKGVQAPMQAPQKEAPMQAPLQAPGKQAPMQAPMQAPGKQAPMQAPMQAPSKMAPLQAPAQAPMQAPMKHVQGPTQAPVKGGGYGGYPPMASAESYAAGPQVAMGRPGLFRRR